MIVPPAPSGKTVAPLWVPAESQTTAPSTSHCARAGAAARKKARNRTRRAICRSRTRSMSRASFDSVEEPGSYEDIAGSRFRARVAAGPGPPRPARSSGSENHDLANCPVLIGLQVEEVEAGADGGPGGLEIPGHALLASRGGSVAQHAHEPAASVQDARREAKGRGSQAQDRAHGARERRIG